MFNSIGYRIFVFFINLFMTFLIAHIYAQNKLYEYKKSNIEQSLKKKNNEKKETIVNEENKITPKKKINKNPSIEKKVYKANRVIDKDEGKKFLNELTKNLRNTINTINNFILANLDSEGFLIEIIMPEDLFNKSYIIKYNTFPHVYENINLYTKEETENPKKNTINLVNYNTGDFIRFLFGIKLLAQNKHTEMYEKNRVIYINISNKNITNSYVPTKIIGRHPRILRFKEYEDKKIKELVR